MPDNAVLIVVIFVCGAAAILAELILPGVILGLIGAAAVVTAIVMAYQSGSPAFGHTLLLITIASVPVLVFLWLKVLSRFLTLHKTNRATVTPKSRQDLVGKQGVTLTKLRPSGVARIDDERVDVMARGEIIEPNTRIEVVAVEGNRVVVREIRA